MRYVSEKAIDEKIAEMRSVLKLGYLIYESQLIHGIRCLETLKACCLEELPEEKLRPMSDAKFGEHVLVAIDDYGTFSGYKSSNDGDVFANGHYFKASQVLGWIPIPKVSI